MNWYLFQLQKLAEDEAGGIMMTEENWWCFGLCGLPVELRRYFSKPEYADTEAHGSQFAISNLAYFGKSHPLTEQEHRFIHAHMAFSGDEMHTPSFRNHQSRIKNSAKGRSK